MQRGPRRGSRAWRTPWAAIRRRARPPGPGPLTPSLPPRRGPTEPAKVSGDPGRGEAGCGPPAGLPRARLRCGAEGDAGVSESGCAAGNTAMEKANEEQNENKRTNGQRNTHWLPSRGGFPRRGVSWGLFGSRLTLRARALVTCPLCPATASSTSAELEAHVPVSD